MPGLLEFFRAAVRGGNGADSEGLRAAASLIDGAAFVQETVSALAGERAQALLFEVLLPWAGQVSSLAVNRWTSMRTGRRAHCRLTVKGEPCRHAAVSGCFGCGKPICLEHAFVGSDSTLVCWECMRVGVSNAPQHKRKNGGNGANHAPPPPPQDWSWDAAAAPSPEEQQKKDISWAYTTLGVVESATDDEVRSAYRKASAKWHPDRAKDPQEAKVHAEMFKSIQLAMQTIRAQRNI